MLHRLSIPRLQIGEILALAVGFDHEIEAKSKLLQQNDCSNSVTEGNSRIDVSYLSISAIQLSRSSNHDQITKSIEMGRGSKTYVLKTQLLKSPLCELSSFHSLQSVRILEKSPDP